MSGTLGSIYHHQLICSECFCVCLHICWDMACSGVHLPPHQVQLLSQGPAEGLQVGATASSGQMHCSHPHQCSVLGTLCSE